MNKIRIQFELPEERVRELEQLMKEADISTKKELLNTALTLFQWVVQEKQNGNIIASIDEKQNRLKELIMPVLSRVFKKKDDDAEEKQLAII
jgi:hypothetical protein